MYLDDSSPGDRLEAYASTLLSGALQDRLV